MQVWKRVICFAQRVPEYQAGGGGVACRNRSKIPPASQGKGEWNGRNISEKVNQMPKTEMVAERLFPTKRLNELPTWRSSLRSQSESRSPACCVRACLSPSALSS